MGSVFEPQRVSTRSAGRCPASHRSTRSLHHQHVTASHHLGIERFDTSRNGQLTQTAIDRAHGRYINTAAKSRRDPKARHRDACNPARIPVECDHGGESATDLPKLASDEDDEEEQTKLTTAALFDSGTVMTDFLSKPYLVLVGARAPVFALSQRGT